MGNEQASAPCESVEQRRAQVAFRRYFRARRSSEGEDDCGVSPVRWRAKSTMAVGRRPPVDAD